MKASIELDKSATPTLKGKLGIMNAPYTATLELTRPDGSVDTLVVPSSNTDAWAVSLDGYAAGKYGAVIRPRNGMAFEGTRLAFSL
ncbi:hypothetical protein BGP84_04480 [Pseudomonas putida]|jgi:hypothetical protein|uniref:Uncharacterized protein n=1 Tax=Pseudomonas putida TaxID=303 RepID=A0A2S3XAR0_PSEPU|nr:hypothetical protein [Pseudomonas putida]POG01881.1 hypothetical protein BGP85_25735 [Pseudomonas putida]POG12547.1 hypothetical protein BGP84_04480 [Pseudomonas putida]